MILCLKMTVAIFLLLVGVNLGFSKTDYDNQPRIQVKDGHLVFIAAPYKNITFETAKTAGVSINNIDLLTTLNKAHDATQLTDNYHKSLTTYNDRLEAIEDQLQRGRGPQIDSSSTNGNNSVMDMRVIRKLRTRITALERWSGTIKTILANDVCVNNPCKNGGTCQNMIVRYYCVCSTGWEGKDCSENVNECYRFTGTDLGCQNGATCVDKPGTYECLCAPGWTGIHCIRRKTEADCLTAAAELCGHGICVAHNSPTGYKCICDQGWASDGINPACTVDVDECKQNRPACSINPKVDCINVPGSFYCGHCPLGYTGNGYHCSDIDECVDKANNGQCSTNPMVLCINTPGSRICGPCPPGYSGDGTTCAYEGVCNINNGGCHHLATCRNTQGISSTYVECVCPNGYTGNGIGPTGCVPSNAYNPCIRNPCKNGDCKLGTNGDYVCDCKGRYIGRNCDVLGQDPCNPNPCQNEGQCQQLAHLTFKCVCKKGFTGDRCTLEESACGGLLRADHGVLKYPSGNFKTYGQSANCAWTIVTNDTSKVLKITFKKFDLEASTECSFDFVEIHDGRNTASPVLGRFCGNKLPLGGNFTSTHNKLYIWFRSDDSDEKGGFEIMWNATDWKCGGVTTTNTHGTIESPGTPGNYPTTRDCWWRLTAPEGKRFLFTFYSLNIGDNKDCGQDLIQFFTMLDYMRDNDKFKRICNSTKPGPFHSPGRNVMIHFHSNRQDTYPGFQLNYVVVDGTPGCGGVYSSLSGYIFPPRETTGDVSTSSCEYKIQQPQNSKIKITFEKFDVGTAHCQSHYLEVFEGPDTQSPSVGRYCESTIPSPYFSLSNVVTILYHYVHVTDIDWKIKYEIACGQKFTNESGTFAPSAYYSSSGTECVYQIERPPGDIIELIIKLSTARYGGGMYSFVSCALTYIEVRDGDLETSPLVGKYCGTKTVNITSSHNALWIKFKIGSYYFGVNGISDAFSAEYTSVHTGCGGILRKPFDHISSPTHVDGGYPPDNFCKWVIIAPPNNIIKLSWQTFNIEASYDCNYDNVQIFDNRTDLGTGESMGKYCGFTTPPVLFSSSNIMTIIFNSDASMNSGGFLASYTFVKESDVCNVNYGTSAGVLKSPNYPNTYPTNRECTYTITVAPGQQIMLNVTDFNLESYPGCRYDWLEVRNGGTSSSPLIGRYCGTTIPRQIVSHTNQIYLFFKTDVSRGAQGFNIVWSSAGTGCGGLLISPTGSIVSPYYPEPYNRNAECIWKIFINAGSKIQAVFSDINLEKHTLCMADYVQLYDGFTINSETLGKFCYEAKGAIMSSANKMMVKFRSDINFQGRGFQLYYSTVCQNILTGFSGIIESPNFPNDYPQDENCLWEIIVANKNKINITFSHFELERSPTMGNNSCLFDYVEILYGKENEDEEEYVYTKYGRYCGYDNPGHMSLDSDHVRIHFVSDRLLLGKGFRLEWAMWGCGGHLTHSTGTIISPNYPNPYPHSVMCQWIIEVEYGKSIEIQFPEIDIEKEDTCEFDYIKVYNGPNNSSNILATLCRQKKPSLISSTGHIMFVEFKTDASNSGKGFKANYSTIASKCGGRLTASEGKIYSPNYPKNYNKNDSCEWLIDVDDGHSVELTFNDVDLYDTANCRNFVKVHDGPSAAYPVLKTVCKSEVYNDTITSTFNHMVVEFKTFSYLTAKGFMATYRKSCGSKIITSSNGNIELEYGEFSEFSGTKCQWTISSSDPTKHVSLIITHIHGITYCDIYEADDEQPVRVYNGESSESPLIGSYCDSINHSAIVSDGAALTVVVDNLQLSFFATYSVYDSHCGGTFNAEQGYFASPGYPKKYPSDTQCEWILQFPPGIHISVNFIEFELVDSENCNTDYLEIRAQNSSGKLLGVYCGTNKPDNLTHVGGLWLMFKSSKIEGSTTAKGIYAQFSSSKENELSGPQGEIYSPLHPKLYLGYGNYEWKITVGLRKKILLTFTEFYLESDDIDGACYFSGIEVYDGVDDTATSLGTYCGVTTPSPIKSNSNIVFIRASFNSPRMGSKFKLKWLEVISGLIPQKLINKTCGSSEVVDVNTLPNNTLTSPGFPNGYANNLHCTWIFSTAPTNHIEIMFSSFNVERIFARTVCDFNDRVKISEKRDGNDWTLVKDICKSEDAIRSVIRGTNLMKVEFITTPIINGTGFKAYVFSICGGSLTEPSGYITFDKNSTKECQWNITVRSTRTIELRFEQFNISKDSNNVCHSYLLIRNGKFPDSPVLGRHCGNELPNAIKSTGNSLYIKYNGTRLNNDNFRIRYREISATCGGEIVLSSAYDNYTEITSPNYPDIPQPHTECQWKIRAPPDETLMIDFEERFDLAIDKNCEIEYVELRDGGTEYSPLIGHYCKFTPSTQISTGNIMFIKYFTDTDEPKNGFKAKISIGYCGGHLRGVSGDIVMSNLPLNIKEHNCTWYITGPKDHYLIITFSQIDTPCFFNKETTNFVKVLEENPDKNNVSTLGKYCGPKPPDANITSSGNELIVRYQGTFAGKFKATFRASQTECGGSLTTESGELTSPGYPTMNHYNRRCIWKIEVPEGRRITVELLDLDFNEISGDQILSFYDGNNYRVQLAFIAGAYSKKTIQSSSNKMIIRFWSKDTSNHRGFKLKYTSNEPTICTGDFSLLSGAISNPSVRNNSYSCEWTRRSQYTVLQQTLALSVTMKTNRDTHACSLAVSELVVIGNTVTLTRLCSSTTQPVIVRSPFLTTSIQAKTRDSMNFTVYYQIHGCGGTIKQQSGYIESPLTGPSNTIECAWLLRMNEGQRINLTAVNVNLGNDCEKSFLIIHNGNSPLHPQIGKYCRNNKPDPILSQGENLWIEYRWEKGSTGIGLKLQYEAVSQGCGGILHDKSRIIESPGYGKDYPNNAECLWEIHSNEGYIVKLQFIDRFHIVESKNCLSDYLEVFDWTFDKWVSLGKKCGRNIPSNILSTSNKLRILFRTDDGLTSSGFKARWDWVCGGTFVAAKIPQYIVSPGYPNLYENNLKCTYIIKSISNLAKVEFLDFDLEGDLPDCEFDNITMTTGMYIGRKTFCGTKAPPTTRFRGPMTISFKTDAFLVKKGFKFMFKDDNCGGNITEETVIEATRQNYPPIYQGYQGTWNRGYLTRLNCIWFITAPPKQVIVLTIINLKMSSAQSCNDESLEIYKGHQPYPTNRLARMCSHIEYLPITSDTDKVRVALNAFPSAFRGFKASVMFSHGSLEGCGGIINLTDTTYIQSPNLENLDCAWKIIAPRDYKVQIQFTTLNLPETCASNSSLSACDCSFIDIRDGNAPYSERIEKICPNTTLSHDYRIFTTSWNRGYLRFYIAGRKENAFKATLTPKFSVCGHSLLNVTKAIQILTSPNYPNPYPPNTRCAYLFTASGLKEQIKLHFVDFELTKEPPVGLGQKRTKCEEDTVEIYEDPNRKSINDEGLGPSSVYSGTTNTNLLVYSSIETDRHTFCGKEDKPFSYYTSGQTITFTMVSLDNTNKGKGFKLQYSLAGCDRNYSEPYGRIVSSKNTTDCSIYITVPESKTISVYFYRFVIPFSLNCTSAALEARSDSPTGKVLLRSCGYRIPNPIFSSSNKLFIRISNVRQSILPLNYEFIYTSTGNGSGCGGELYSSRGKIYSPGYPNPFRNNSECEWIIQSPIGLHTIFKFTSFDVEGTCEQTYVEVTVQPEVTTRFCKGVTPSVVRSTSYIKIRYVSTVNNGGTGWVGMYRSINQDVTSIAGFGTGLGTI